MKRVITEFKSAPHQVLELISKQYPFGYDESHLVNFMNSKGEYFHALEVKTDDAIYLIKQDRNLDQHISDFLNPESSVKKVFDEMDSNPEDLEEEVTTE